MTRTAIFFLIVTCLLTASISTVHMNAETAESPSSKSLIHETSTLASIWKETLQVDEETLVVFDVDNVILTPTDAILRFSAEPYRIQLRKKYFSQFSKEKMQELACHALLKQDWCSLVDKDLLNLIDHLKDKRAKIIALTANTLRDRFGSIENMEEWKVQKLRNLGVDFSQSFQDFPSLRLDESCFIEKNPSFKQGVLFSSPYSKGLVLQHFLHRINFCPKKIIFIDDNLEYLKSVESAMDQKKIPFVGFLYTAIHFLPFEIDEEVADFQYRYLVENEVWLGDTEAKNLLRENLTATSLSPSRL